jgi:hypothetical protein
MNDTPISTQPLSSSDKALREKFVESIAGQSERMDRLGQQLIAIELAIPSLYATSLKLISGNKATIHVGNALYLTFACWFLALLLTLLSLIPRSWKVDPGVIKRDAFDQGADLGIEDFFCASARYKRCLLIASSLFFFAGAVSAAFTFL